MSDDPQRAVFRPPTREPVEQPPRNPVLPDDALAEADAQAKVGMSAAMLVSWQHDVPRRFWNAKVGDFTDPLGAELAAWADDPERGNLVLLGAVGVGKTHGAVAACRRPYGDGATMVFLPVGELLDQLDWRRPDSAQTMERLCAVDLLVVDDLGTERSNEWTGERLYLVVNRRWLDGRPTIITSNMTAEQLTEAVGERTYSRLRDDATALMFTGEDRRHAR